MSSNNTLATVQVVHLQAGNAGDPVDSPNVVGTAPVTDTSAERQITIATIGAFLIESVPQALRAEAFEQYGAYELVRQLAKYAIYIADLVEAADQHNASWNGVLEYEVAAPFGLWYVQEAVKSDAPPDEIACKAWLLRSVAWFFTKEEPIDRARALETVLKIVQ